MNYYITDTNGKTYIKISFKLAGKDIGFDDITNKMKLTPTVTKKEADYPDIVKDADIRKDLWIFSTCYNESLLVAEEIEKILHTIFDKIEVINELKKKHNMTSTLIISIQANTKPYPLIPLRCIEFAYKTNTEIEFNPYYY
jgi:hypothetical protein